jgi:hypothetical protein
MMEPLAAQHFDVNLTNSKVTGLQRVHLANSLQSRPSQGYLIVDARQISYPPGGPDYALDLFAPMRVAVPARAGSWFPPPAIPGA